MTQRIGRRLVARAAVAVLATAAFASGGTVVAAAGDPTADTLIRERLGVYPGFGDADEIRSVEQMLGYNLNVVVQFGGRKSPDDLTGSIIGQLGDLAPWIAERDPLYSVAIPLGFGEADARTEEGKAAVVDNLTRIAAGEFDGTYFTVAQRLADFGVPDAVIRLGHEFEAVWYPWSAQASCEGYVAAFRHVATVFRQVSPNFRIEWTGGSRRFVDYAECAYPGDEYVDILGMTVFDKGGPMQYFAPDLGTWRDPTAVWAEQFLPSIQFHHNFAVQHGKPVSYPEWGVVATDAGAYGGDNPTFVHSMAAWLRSLPASGPGSLTYHAYFLGREQFDVRLLEQSNAAFLAEFGLAQ